MNKSLLAGFIASAVGAAWGIFGAGEALGQVETRAAQHVPMQIEGLYVEPMPVLLRPSRQVGGVEVPQYGDRDNCPVVYTHTNANFSGGTFTAQGGFAEGEIAAVSYELPGNLFPLKFQLAECIIAQQNATVTTTTFWSILVWEGTPATGTLIAEFNSDGTILPHIVMGPGTRGTNVQAQVDPNDPEQIFIFNPQNLATQTFSVGFRIDQHNDQTANPCLTAPPSARNAFPATDNTSIGCGTGYGQLARPTQNWLFALNCGPNGCPPNGGWARFSNLQTDQSLLGFCLTGCRPRGDWVIRVTVDPVNCPPPEGACCFGSFGCAVLTQAACASAGGSWRGGGSSCGTLSSGEWSGCTTPQNQAPNANAGSDLTVTDADNSGDEIVTVDGIGSSDPDGFISNYRWTKAGAVLQDGPSFLSTSLPVGVHTLTLTVTDNGGLTDTDDVVVTVLAGAPTCAWESDSCFADFNNDDGIDGDDVIAFFASWDQSNGCADVNADEGVDGDDVIAFFSAWDASGSGQPGC